MTIDDEMLLEFVGGPKDGHVMTLGQLRGCATPVYQGPPLRIAFPNLLDGFHADEYEWYGNKYRYVGLRP